MCGILGILQHTGQPIELANLAAANALQQHRGPDDDGFLLGNRRSGELCLCAGAHTDPRLRLPPLEQCQGDGYDLAFGFNRLAILDLSPAGHQPMASADGRLWIVFNGEVYNYVELRSELQAQGYQFRSGSDTEVILAAYQHWGPDCLRRFVGMWALAIWDRQAGALLLARDPFGIKPLYYVASPERLAFASEIKTLLALSGASRQVNPQRLYAYLRFGVTDHGDQTLFADIAQLAPAHYLQVDLQRPQQARPVRYWQLDPDRQLDISFDEAASQLRELFLDSVRLHLRSDVPVGAALSGGIDSSAIVCAMRQLEPGLELHTFSYVAEDPQFNEERWVDCAAQASRALVHKVQPRPEELVADLDRLICSQDLPFGSTSIYAQQRVFQLARQVGIKVMLDGQGADELLGGYRTFLAARAASLLRQGQLREAVNLLRRSKALPGTTGRKLLFRTLGLLLPPELRRRTMGLAGEPLLPTWLNGDWFTSRGVVPAPAWRRSGRQVLRTQLAQSLDETVLPALLRYEDRNSMASSIESRVPFLTTSMAEFILALPEHYIIAPDGTSKAVFRRAMRGVVPDAILDRSDKIGFATPEQRWLSTLRPWVEELLRSDTAASIPVLQHEAVSQEWRAVLAGAKPFDFRLWRWINLIRWAELLKVGFA